MPETLLHETSKKQTLLEKGSQGPPGPAGLSASQQAATVGAGALSGHSVVAVASDGTLVPADATNPAHYGRVFGMTVNAYSAGVSAIINRTDVIEHNGWTLVPDGLVFVGTNGQITQTPPVGAIFVQVIGTALTATRIFLNIQPPIVTI